MCFIKLIRDEGRVKGEKKESKKREKENIWEKKREEDKVIIGMQSDNRKTNW